MPESQSRAASNRAPLNFVLPATLQLAGSANAKGGTTIVPVTLVARSGDPVTHPYWGPIVHDFAGMQHKGRIPIDYYHCEPIGYADAFDVSGGDLVCGGALVIVADEEYPNTLALVQKMQAGVPYEASIEFGEEFSFEFIPEGMTTSVNGRDVSGPMTVIRQWTLKAVAVCKFGVDGDTSVELQLSKVQTKPAAKRIFVRVSHEGGEMSKTNESAPAPAATTPPAANPQTQLSATPAPTTAAPSQPSTPTVSSEPTKAVDSAPPATQLSQPSVADGRSEAKRFMDAFGEPGAVYFAQGKTFDEAVALHRKAQDDRIADLSRQLSASKRDRGATEPVPTGEPAAAPVDANVARLSRNLGPNLARVAASIKVPTAPTVAK